MNILKVDIDVVILCGGLGKRLKTLFPNTPKALVGINDVPFLDKLMTIINKQGFEQFILCVGHLKQQIIDRYSNSTNFDVSYSLETEQLGTGGAIKNALPLIKNKFFIAMNGDSFCNVSLKSLIEFHQKNNADISVVISPADIERDDVGQININKMNRITSFEEKANNLDLRHVNSGIYVINKSVLAEFSGNIFSLERDFFPFLIQAKKIYGFKTNNPVYDIGTPDRYKKFIKNEVLNDF